jgi:hypothetical protein
MGVSRLSKTWGDVLSDMFVDVQEPVFACWTPCDRPDFMFTLDVWLRLATLPLALVDGVSQDAGLLGTLSAPTATTASHPASTNVLSQVFAILRSFCS